MELKLLRMFRYSLLFSLLIVPYGIETTMNTEIFSFSVLLIVPYGIETKNRDWSKEPCQTF